MHWIPGQETALSGGHFTAAPALMAAVDPTHAALVLSFVAAMLVAALAVVLHRRLPAGQSQGRGEPLFDPLVPPPASRFSFMGSGRVGTGLYLPADGLVALSMVGIYAWLALAQAAIAGQGEARDITLADLVVSIGFQAFMAGIALMVVSSRLRPSTWLGLRWQGWPMMFALVPLSVLAMWLVFGLLQFVGYLTWLESLDVQTVQDSVRVLREQQDALLVATMGFSAVVVAPVCEEIVFRGYLYGVGKRFLGPLAAAICSALVFSAAHASLVALLPLFLFGLLLSWLHERTGSIWAPVATHACFNSATVIQLALA